jgi:hypothetical protein
VAQRCRVILFFVFFPFVLTFLRELPPPLEDVAGFGPCTKRLCQYSHPSEDQEPDETHLAIIIGAWAESSGRCPFVPAFLSQGIFIMQATQTEEQLPPGTVSCKLILDSGADPHGGPARTPSYTLCPSRTNSVVGSAFRIVRAATTRSPPRCSEDHHATTFCIGDNVMARHHWGR